MALFAYPEIALGDLAGGPETLVLTPTARLATEVRQGHGVCQQARGLTTWRALNGATPAQWLDHLCSAALLRGEIPAEAVPGTFLTWPQERCLWQQAVAEDVAEKSAGVSELFDHEGLALLAMDADSVIRTWRVEVPEVWRSDEFHAFTRWRGRMTQAAEKHAWIGAQQALRWRIDCVARGLSGLPARVGLAGFVTPDPMLEHLLAVLAARGVELFQVRLGAEEGGSVQTVACIDAHHECLAAALWARDWLVREPQARLRIGVADWSARRQRLESALDAALHPDAIGAGWVGLERAWSVIGGEVLADHPLVSTALRLLQLVVHPRQVSFTEWGALLCGNGWSADVTEADARAQIEAALRELLPPETTLERLQRRLASADLAQFHAPRIRADTERLGSALRGQSSRQLPGAWGERFHEILDSIGWPGQRVPSATEASVCRSLRDTLSGLVTFDPLVGRVDAAGALRLLRQAVRELSWTVPRQRPAAVEIGRLDDVLGAPVDGLWLMGMNEGAWPPLPRPNPLLPAPLQRRAGIPEATSAVLSAVAQRLQALWLAQGREVRLSWAGREGERHLRISPALATLPAIVGVTDEVTGLASEVPVLERVSDAQAPVVDVAERSRLRGGTALLAAQSVCPAWGFYQYRLGAAVLPAPTYGLDATIRGSLLHAALETFWSGRGLADLRAMGATGRQHAIAQCVDSAITRQQERDPERVSARLLELERERLQTLLDVWMDLEMQRAEFTVVECETRHPLEIAGLPVRVVVDRVDRLADGRLVVVDYKSGRSVSADSWADARMVEPQLPIYAGLAFPESELAAAVLARVVRDDPAFLGVAEEDGMLPGIKSLAAQHKRYPPENFPDWQALRRLWAQRIENLAREIIAGEAAVRVGDEASLAYCPVMPLLRLAERRRQFEERS